MFRRVNTTCLTAAGGISRKVVPSATTSALFSSNNSHKKSTTAANNLMPLNQNQQALLLAMQFNAMRFQSSSSSTSDSNNKGGSVEASADTHPDFQPKPIKSDDNTEERQEIMNDIRDTIKDEDVVVFIKGLPECPVCSFSKKMVDILDALQLEYTSFDVLAHPVVRSYVKEVSDWGTIPQVFVKGEFVGGVDIVAEMAKKGQFQLMLESKGVPFKPYHF